jgi:hypothetical protein
MDNNGNLNIAEINRDLQESFIHYDPNRVDYTINNLELDILEQTGSSIWKDVFLASLGLGVPSIINGLTDYCNLLPPVHFTASIFLNLLVGCISFIISVICFIVWQQNKKNFKKIIEQIKKKPKYKIPGTGH